MKKFLGIFRDTPLYNSFQDFYVSSLVLLYTEKFEERFYIINLVSARKSGYKRISIAQVNANSCAHGIDFINFTYYGNVDSDFMFNS